MIDLHAHSTASDGSDEPRRIPELAAAAGLSAVALTDHDTVEGLAEATAAAGALGVRLVPGTEISCEVERGTMHLVVLFLDDEPGPLQDRLAELQAARETRNDQIAEALQAHGMDVSVDEIVEEAGGGSVGRPHIAAVLLRKGYVESIQDAFDRWLAKGKPAYAERLRLGPEESIELAHASGAVTVLAHPHTLDLGPANLDRFVEHLAGVGLDGMEVAYGRYTTEEREHLGRMAARHGLCPSGGSDYHGTYKPDLSLGTGRGDLMVPDEWLDALEARRPSPRPPS